MILQKFLRANANDLFGAKTQLTNALNWRKSYQPAKAVDEVFNSTKFGGLGFVTTIKGAKETKNDVDVATFNIYGAVGKDTKTTFGDTDAFVRWRVALMVSRHSIHFASNLHTNLCRHELQEITLAQLKLNEADKAIPDYLQGSDPYQVRELSTV